MSIWGLRSQARQVSIESLNAAAMMDVAFLNVKVSNDSDKLIRNLEFSAWETSETGEHQRVGTYLGATRLPGNSVASGGPGGGNTWGMGDRELLLVATFEDLNGRWWLLKTTNSSDCAGVSGEGGGPRERAAKFEQLRSDRNEDVSTDHARTSSFERVRPGDFGLRRVARSASRRSDQR